MSVVDPLIGRLVGGRYKIVRPLASGGMGAVYDAVQESLQRDVAVKVIRPRHAEPGRVDERFRLRFEAEAVTTSRLKDPHVVTVHDFGIDGDLPYLVLEKLDGRDLATELGARGRLPWLRGARVLRGIAAALVAAAHAGVVHRDLKPSNVFLVNTPADPDFVKVLDFGIAKLLDSDAPQAETDTGSVVGTPGYVAPERLMGAPDDARSDLYSLGVIAWEVLAGRAPFTDNQGMQLALRHLQEPPPGLATVVDVPPALAALVDQLLCKSPDLRPSAADVVARLDALEREERAAPGDGGPPAPGPERPWSGRPGPREGTAPIELVAVKHGAPAAPAAIGPSPMLTESSSRVAMPMPASWSRTPPTSAPQSLPQASPASSPRRGPVVAVIAVIAVVVAVVAVAVVVRGGARDAPQVSLAPRRLTWEAGVERDPALSPDGLTVAWVAPGAGGVADLFLLRLDGGAPANLSNTPDAIESGPAFSADGLRLAWSVHDDEGDAVWVGGPRAEGGQRLIDDAVSPAWSPDGARLVYGTVGFDEPEAVSTGRLAQVKSYEMASRASRVISDHLASFEPVLAPDGQRVAFWSVDRDGHRDLWTVLPGGAPVAVTADAAVDFSPVWSSDGSALRFLSDRGGTMGLWSVDVDEDSGAAVGAPEPVSPGGIPMRGVAVAGDRVVYRSGTTSTVIERRSIDVGAGTLGPAVPLLETARELKSLDASPDGRWLVAEVLGPKSDVLLIATDGRTQRLLTDDDALDRSPRFVDDGHVAFASNRGGAYGIWIVDVETPGPGSGGGLRALPAGACPTVAPLPSPDGRWLAAWQLDCGDRLAVYDLATGDAPRQVQLARGAISLPMGWRGAGTVVVNRVGAGYDVVDLDSGAITPHPLILGGIAVLDERRLLALAGRALVVVDGDSIKAIERGEGGPLVAPFQVPADVADPSFALAANQRVVWIAGRRDQSDLWLAQLPE